MSKTASSIRKAGSIAAVGLVVRTASQVMSLVLLLLAGRFLTIELFGVFALAVILLNLSQVLLYSGIYNFILKEPGIDEFLGTAMTLQMLMALVFAAAIGGLGALVLTFSQAELLGQLILATAPLPLIGFVACWQEAMALREHRVRLYYACLFLAEFAGFVTGIALLIGGFGVWALIVSRYVAGVALSVGLTFISGKMPRPGFSMSAARKITGYSIGLYGGSALTFFTTYWSDIIIGLVLSTRAVGLFRMGARTATAAFDVFAQTTRVLSWQVTGRAAREGRSDDPIWVSMYAAVLAVMLGALGSMAVLGRELTLSVLGEEWLPMVPVLQIICAVRVLASFDLVATAQLAAHGDTRFLFRMRLAEALIMASSLFFAVPHGAEAVALGLFPSTLFLLVMLMRRTCQSTGTRLRDVAWQLLPSVMIASSAILPAAITAQLMQDQPPLMALGSATLAGVTGIVFAGLVVFGRWTRSIARRLSLAMLPADKEARPEASA